MAQQRRSTVAICRPAAFAVQSTFLTAIAQASITVRLPLSDEDPKLEYISEKDELLTCSGQDIDDRILRSRMQRLTYGIKAVPSEIFGHFGWAFGVVAGDEVTLLSETEFQPPPTTLIYGHVGSGVQPYILKSMVLMKINISASATGGYTVNFEWLGHGNPAKAVAYSWPACPETVGARLKDGTFNVNSVDELLNTDSYDFSFDNKPDAADPFTLAGPDITRNERADLRGTLLKWKNFGETGDAYYVAGIADPTTRYPFSFRIGSAVDGVSVAATSALFESDGGEGYAGGFKRSIMPYNLTPRGVDSLLVTSLTA